VVRGPGKTKFGTEVAHITRDSDITFKVKRSSCRGGGILWQSPAQLVNLVKLYNFFSMRLNSQSESQKKVKFFTVGKRRGRWGETLHFGRNSPSPKKCVDKTV